MDAKTLEALRASIAKWERNAEAETPEDIKTRWSECPLCLLFNNPDDTTGSFMCAGCPVLAETGRPSCMDTPYDDAVTAKQLWSLDLLDFPLDRVRLERRRDAAHAAAREEVAFLKSLLPEGERDA